MTAKFKGTSEKSVNLRAQRLTERVVTDKMIERLMMTTSELDP